MCYLKLYELKNNNILIHSHSSGSYEYFSGCVNKTINLCKNKLFILNYKNFEIQNLSKTNDKINIMNLQKYICIIFNYKNISIYDIENYNLLKTIKKNICSIIKYDDNIILILDNYSQNNIILYDLSDINNIQYQIIKTINILDIIDKQNFFWNERIIHKFNDRQIVIINSHSIFIFDLPKLDFLPL